MAGKAAANIVLIPAAKPIAPELQFEFGRISPCMIPMLGKPLFYHIAKKYNACKKLIVASYNDERTINYSKYIDNGKIHICEVTNTNSIAETVIFALEKENLRDVKLIINFADTITENNLTQKDVIIYEVVNDKSRWTCFENKNGQIFNIKDRVETEDEEPANAFVGVFKFSKPSLFIKLLNKHHSAKRQGVEPFYLALQDYAKQVSVSFIQAKSWKDFGHVDNYFSMRHDLSMGEREFNQLNISRDSGVIRKYSKNAQKLINETNWYLRLPKQVSHITPRVIDYDLGRKMPYVDLEFYSYPSLSDLHLFSNFESAIWKKIFGAIFAVTDMMQKYTVKDSAQKIILSLEDIYYKKTISRINEVIGSKKFSSFTDNVVINNKRCKGLKEIKSRLRQDLEKMRILENQKFNIIHGDLCLSNILYDRKMNIIRLIDPRGSFGSYDIYGDTAYDFAKLSHSILGDYDFMVNNLCKVNKSGEKYELVLFHSEKLEQIKNIFRKMLAEKAGKENLAKIRFIESLLFLSMVPLHNDNYEAQKAFLCKGIALYNETISQLP